LKDKTDQILKQTDKQNQKKSTTSDRVSPREYNQELKWCSKGLAWPDAKIHCIVNTNYKED
jgi:hypothetical protein